MEGNYKISERDYCLAVKGEGVSPTLSPFNTKNNKIIIKTKKDEIL
tara:strand:+ start:961 stop:1098 length:138 start_codon:yes stop_codon:yes gene_type:complete